MSLWIMYTSVFIAGIMLVSMGYSGLADVEGKTSGFSALTFLAGIFLCMAVIFHIVTGGA